MLYQLFVQWGEFLITHMYLGVRILTIAFNNTKIYNFQIPMCSSCNQFLTLANPVQGAQALNLEDYVLCVSLGCTSSLRKINDKVW